MHFLSGMVNWGQLTPNEEEISKCIDFLDETLGFESGTGQSDDGGNMRFGRGRGTVGGWKSRRVPVGPSTDQRGARPLWVHVYSLSCLKLLPRNSRLLARQRTTHRRYSTRPLLFDVYSAEYLRP